jgi:hypothetical protein
MHISPRWRLAGGGKCLAILPIDSSALPGQAPEWLASQARSRSRSSTSLNSRAELILQDCIALEPILDPVGCPRRYVVISADDDYNPGALRARAGEAGPKMRTGLEPGRQSLMMIQL